MQIVKLRTAIFMAWLSVSSAPAWAQEEPSFDCSRARTAVEHTLCDFGNSGMGWLDQTMSALYKDALIAAGSQADTVRASQRAWLARRNQCSGSEEKIKSCLDKSYRARFMEIAKPYDSTHITGRYSNEAGVLEAVLFPGQNLAVSINASRGAPSYNQCNLTFRAPLQSGTLKYIFPVDSNDSSLPRCSVETKRVGQDFVVTATNCSDMCGYGVEVSGTYKH
ncbi:hypothetical protein BCF11_0854 [Collimonas sp. PA-H2]|uniref:lysozyme inhibitor LprI family protein n=1 Tax=Collimonas sp. PA-H2 TaxID=1881062 RepID=UPI000C010FD0|nr:hypothetical protein [Collimonas sp. PA-H2]PFH08499.1 hypothetical protein BCF11_0854 [Collimonas sp. PA-H2]